jgi:hypothetical protein
MALNNKIALWNPAIGDVGTFLDSSAVPDSSMGVDKLQTQQPTERWRTTAEAAAYFEMDFGTDYSVDTVCMLFTNATNSAQIRVRLHSTADFSGSVDFDTGWESHWPEWDDNGTPTKVAISGWDRNHAMVNFAETTKRYLRVDVNDTGNPDGYYEAGRLYVSAVYQPTINPVFGASVPWPAEQKVKMVSVGGAIHPVAQPKIMNVRCTMQFKYEDEMMEELYELARVRGSSGDLLYSHNPTSKWLHHFFLYGTMSEPTRNSVPEYGIWTVDFAMEALV